METLKGSLDGMEPKVDTNAVYMIDFSKMESVNDLILIISSMGISFSPLHPHWEMVKRFANLENPIYPNQQIQPKKQETKEEDIIKLPKLKSLK